MMCEEGGRNSLDLVVTGRVVAKGVEETCETCQRVLAAETNDEQQVGEG